MSTRIWTTGSREALLEALRVVLGGIEGVKTVRRHPPTHELNVAENEAPAIFIDDSKASFEWLERHGRRVIGTRNAIILDCHAIALNQAGRRHYTDAPTLRNAFARRIMFELANNPRLEVQLEGEDGVQPHAKDVAHSFQLQTVPIPPPWIRFALVIQGNVDDCLDGRTKTDWERILLCIQPETPGIVKPSGRVVELDALDLVDWLERRNPVALYRCDTARDLKDTAANGYDLAFTGDVTRYVDPIAEGFEHATLFSGGAAWIAQDDLPELATLTADDSLSIVVLARRDADLAGASALATIGALLGPYIQLQTNAAGETILAFKADGDGDTAQILSGGASSTGDIVLHVVTLDREANEARVYQSGALVATLPNLNDLANGFAAAGGQLVSLGANAIGPTTGEPPAPTSLAQQFEGTIQVAAFLPAALTDDDAARLAELAGLA